MEEEKFVLTEQACVQAALKDFGIDVSIIMAGAIWNDLCNLMVKQGHMRRVENEPSK